MRYSVHLHILPLLVALVVTACAGPVAPPLDPPRYPRASIADLLKAESAFTEVALASRRSSIEKLFWDLEKSDPRDTTPLRFTIGDSCYELETEQNSALPKLFKKRCGSPQRMLFVDFAAVCAILWPGEVQPISAIRVRPDGAGVAFTTGGRLAAVDAVTHSALMYPGPAPQEFEWFNDSAHLLTVTNFPSKSVLAVTDLSDQIVIETIEDGRSYFHIERASSGNFLLLDRKSVDTDSWTALDIRDPQVTSVALSTSTPGAASAVCDTGDFWIWATGDSISAIPNRASASERKFSIPSTSSISALHCFQGKVVAELQDGWSQRLLVIDPGTGSAAEAPIPAAWVSVKPLQFFGATEIVIERQGPAELPSRCTVSLLSPGTGAGNCEPRPVPELEVSRVTAKSGDGTIVPITVLFDPSRRKRSGNPLLLHAYGAYGVGLPLQFDPAMRLLVERGYIVAIANVRGGGPGMQRHRGGMGALKSASVDDIAAAARHLVHVGFADPRRVYGYGRSAGAALVAAAAKRNSGLFSGLLLEAPLLRPRTVVEAGMELFPGRERAEWGDPKSPPDAAVLQSLDAVQAMKQGELPPIFLTFSSRDGAVPLEDILTFITEARTTGRTNARLFVLPREAASHAGEDYREGSHRISATQIGFLEWLDSSR